MKNFELGNSSVFEAAKGVMHKKYGWSDPGLSLLSGN